MKQELFYDKNNKIKIRDCLKLLPNGAEVLDYHKLIKIFKDFRQFFIMAPRGEIGKTTNLKIKALDDFNKLNMRSLFVRNQESEIEEEKRRFLENSTCEADKRFYDCEIVQDQMLWNKKAVIDFQSMYKVAKMKGSRRQYANIICDEMNEGMTLLNRTITENISSLNASTYDIVKNRGQVDNTRIWFLGNLKTINHPYLISCGITDIHSTCDVYYDKAIFDDGEIRVRPAFVVLCVLYTQAEKEKLLKERWDWDWRLRNDVRIKEVGHTYFNETLKDEMLNVGNIDEKKYSKTLYFVLNVDGRNKLAIYKINNFDFLYATLIDNKEIDYYKSFGTENFVFNKKDILEDWEFYPKLNQKLKEFVWKNQVFYKSQMARSLFLSNLLKT